MFKDYFPKITRSPDIVYPGINIGAYDPRHFNPEDDEIQIVSSYAFSLFLELPKADLRCSSRPTLLSLNRFEKKKNAALAVKAFTLLLQRLTHDMTCPQDLRLVLAGKKKVTGPFYTPAEHIQAVMILDYRTISRLWQIS